MGTVDLALRLAPSRSVIWKYYVFHLTSFKLPISCVCIIIMYQIYSRSSTWWWHVSMVHAWKMVCMIRSVWSPLVRIIHKPTRWSPTSSHGPVPYPYTSPGMAFSITWTQTWPHPCFLSARRHEGQGRYSTLWVHHAPLPSLGSGVAVLSPSLVHSKECPHQLSLSSHSGSWSIFTWLTSTEPPRCGGQSLSSRSLPWHHQLPFQGWRPSSVFPCKVSVWGHFISVLAAQHRGEACGHWCQHTELKYWLLHPLVIWQVTQAHCKMG